MFSYDEAFRMISLFKGQIRNVKEDTSQIMSDRSLTNDEKYKKICDIERDCIDKTIVYMDVSSEFIIDLHKLLTTYKVGDVGRESAYRKFLTQHVNGNIEDIVGFMNSELLGEYDHAIRRHKVLIQMIKEK